MERVGRKNNGPNINIYILSIVLIVILFAPIFTVSRESRFYKWEEIFAFGCMIDIERIKSVRTVLQA